MVDTEFLNIPEGVLTRNFDLFAPRRNGLFETPTQCGRCAGVRCHDNPTFGQGGVEWAIESTNGQKALAEVPGATFSQCYFRARHRLMTGVQLTANQKEYGMVFGKRG